MRFTYAILLLVAFAVSAFGQSAPRELMEWRQTAATGTQWNLYVRSYCDGKRCFPERQVGAFEPTSGVYRELLNGTQWSEPKQPPIPAPAKATGATGQLDESPAGQNFGVEPSKRAKRDKVTFQGTEITQAEALQLAAGGSPNVLPEDAAKPHLTIAARDKATLDAIEKDMLMPEAAKLYEHYRVQLYDISAKVDAEIMKPFALERDPRYSKDGSVCFLQEPMSEGPAKVFCAVGPWKGNAQLLAAVRSADPTWDPSKISLPGSIPSLSSALEWAKANPVWVLVGAIAAWWLYKRSGVPEKATTVWRDFSRPWTGTPYYPAPAPPAAPAPAPPPPRI